MLNEGVPGWVAGLLAVVVVGGLSAAVWFSTNRRTQANPYTEAVRARETNPQYQQQQQQEQYVRAHASMFRGKD